MMQFLFKYLATNISWKIHNSSFKFVLHVRSDTETTQAINERPIARNTKRQKKTSTSKIIWLENPQWAKWKSGVLFDNTRIEFYLFYFKTHTIETILQATWTKSIWRKVNWGTYQHTITGDLGTYGANGCQFETIKITGTIVFYFYSNDCFVLGWRGKANFKFRLQIDRMSFSSTFGLIFYEKSDQICLEI